MKSLNKLFAVLLVLGFAGACAPSSRITGSWKNNSVPRYSTMLVASFTQRVENKSTIEGDLANALSSRGVKVSKSIDVFPPKISNNPTKDDMLEKIRKNGTAAIMTVTLVDQKTESRYVPGAYGYTPLPMYSRFGGFYNVWQPTMLSPDYYTQDKLYYMETNVYDAKTEELVWSAQTETMNPENLSSFSRELATIISAKLEKDGIIGSKKIAVSDNKTTASKK